MSALYEIEIDSKEVTELMEAIKNHLTADRFNAVMRSEFRRLTSPVKKILGDDVPKQYQVKPATVKKTVGNAIVKTGNGVGCVIPIRGSRGRIAGLYSATGGAHGWNIRGKYKIKAKIVKDSVSILPSNMSNMGGQPPFRNYGARKIGSLAFTRMGKSRLPIKPVVGIAIPQMPMNRSMGQIEKDVKELMENRMEHVYEKVLEGVIK